MSQNNSLNLNIFPNSLLLEHISFTSEGNKEDAFIHIWIYEQVEIALMKLLQPFNQSLFDSSARDETTHLLLSWST